MTEPLAPSVVTLSELRRRLGRSQAEIATAIGTTQSGVSRIEHQSDMHMSTLDEYVRALDGRLRLVVDHADDQTEIAIPSLQPQPPIQRREFRVIWQDQETRTLVHVGWLEFTGAEFLFSYTNEAGSHARFQPFPRLPFVDDDHRSSELFPFFAVRLTSTADPEYDAVLDALGLTREDATPAELLARSPADSPHDTIQVVPEAVEMSDGTLIREFLVSGTRHADAQDPGVSQLIETLSVGSRLQPVREPQNPTNPEALHLAADGRRVGWVPDYLLSEIHSYINSNQPVSFVVARANGPDVPWHLRLLCRLTVAPGLSARDR